MNGTTAFRRCYQKILSTTNQNINMDINAACMYLRQGDILRFGVHLYDMVTPVRVTEGYLCKSLLKEI